MPRLQRPSQHRSPRRTPPHASESLPLSLDRGRIQLRPTMFGGFIAATLATMLIGALNYNNNPALLLALLLAATVIASVTMAHQHLSGLRIEAITAEPVNAGQPLRVRLILSSTDQRQRPGLRLDLAEQHCYCSVPAAGVTAELILPSTQRGWQAVGRLRISTTQPLGLVRCQSWLRPQTSLLVHPRPESQAPALPDDHGTSPRQRSARQGTQMQQLRGYRDGDPVHAISWKHSARLHHLLVREFETPAETELTLDWQRLAGLPHEQRIARLAHWVEAAERQRLRYRLCLPGQVALGPDGGENHRRRCLRALALLPYG